MTEYVLHGDKGEIIHRESTLEAAITQMRANCPDGTYLLTGTDGTDCAFDLVDGWAWPSGGTIQGQRFEPRSHAECRGLSRYRMLEKGISNVNATVEDNEIQVTVCCGYTGKSDPLARVYVENKRKYIAVNVVGLPRKGTPISLVLSLPEASRFTEHITRAIRCEVDRRYQTLEQEPDVHFATDETSTTALTRVFVASR